MASTFEYVGKLQYGLGRNSRYRFHRIIKVDGVSSQETWIPPVIADSEGDRLHRVTAGRKWRLDLLADYYYGDQSLWWVIAFANDIIDPFLELEDTSTPIFLKIPSPKSIISKIVS